MDFPRFDALLKRHMLAQRREDLRLGVAVSWLLAPHTKKPPRPAEVYPDPDSASRRLTNPADIQAALRSIAPKKGSNGTP